MTLRRVSVLLNAFSGSSARERTDKLSAELETAFAAHQVQASLEFLTGEELRPGAERALQSVRQGKSDALVAGGGDGTVSTVAGVLADSDVPLGILPLGTLNHFAKDLKIPLAVDDAVALIAAGHTRAVDMGEVNGRTFINNSSIGIYPYLVVERERRRHRKGLPKWLAMIPAAPRAIRYFPLRRLSIETPGGAETYRSPCVFVGNNVYRISGSSLGTRDRLDAGQLSLYVAKQESRLGLLWLACRSILGLLDQRRDLRAVQLAAVTINSHERRLLVAFDGEVETIRSPLHYRIKPGALHVFAASATNA